MHVCDVDGEGEVCLSADAPVVAASVFKVSVALEFFRQASAGDLDPTARVRLDPRSSIGASAGLSLFSDDIEVSLRDLAVSMITVSDAMATDVLLQRVGIDRVNEFTRSLGLTQTALVGEVQLDIRQPGARAGVSGPLASGSRDTWTDAEETERVLASICR